MLLSLFFGNLNIHKSYNFSFSSALNFAWSNPFSLSPVYVIRKLSADAGLCENCGAHSCATGVRVYDQIPIYFSHIKWHTYRPEAILHRYLRNVTTTWPVFFWRSLKSNVCVWNIAKNTELELTALSFDTFAKYTHAIARM